MTDDRPCQARPRAEIEREFMTRNRPRTEQEWWAIDEIERLREEITSFREMEYRFACVLDHATGGRMAKTSYAKETMYAEIDDHITRLVEDAVKDELTTKDT